MAGVSQPEDLLHMHMEAPCVLPGTGCALLCWLCLQLLRLSPQEQDAF